ncbi:probable XKS1 - xylulokinase [Ustilago trichophora]|uniref:Xylulose kinase n=1 Tax=Ustilago trichophora TaxID=86804 RepID=A0A5C3E1V3_9BASI|nr:probable XKS1 - xylulokinase [Ustilago trichophora]
MDDASPLFLGLDASTQALKASLLDQDLKVVSELEVRFDCDLPHYGTTGGVSPPTSTDDEGTVVAPVMLYVESLDLLAERMRDASWPLSRITAVSAAGQQHASVYFSRAAPRIFTTLSSEQTLKEQVKDAFSRKVVPNWQDSSTVNECQALETAMGGAEELAKVTGSKAHTRFTGPQIYKFRKQQPEEYRNTERIGLVSSFITTMLCVGEGEDEKEVIKGIDESDACGMNLLDMRSTIPAGEKKGEIEVGWNQKLLALVSGDSEGADASLGGAAELERKLGKIYRDTGAPVGKIGSWWQKRYGFSATCQVFPGTGDNPATFLAFSLAERQAIISLGTSDTVMVATNQYVPDPDFHAFFHPAKLPSTEGAKAFFNMLVYKSGSLAREWVRDQYCQADWDRFNGDVEEFKLKQEGEKRVGFYWLRPEIIPSGASGVHRYTTANKGEWDKVDAFKDKGMNASAILETQFLNYRYRSSSIISGPSPSSTPFASVDTTTLPLASIYAVGGASSNSTITQTMADVFGCDIVKPVQPSENGSGWSAANYNFCSVGAAYKAAWGWTRVNEGKMVEFDDFVRATKEKQAQKAGVAGQKDEGEVEGGVQVICRPREGRTKVYTDVIGAWKTLEDRAQAEQ